MTQTGHICDLLTTQDAGMACWHCKTLGLQLVPIRRLRTCRGHIERNFTRIDSNGTLTPAAASLPDCEVAPTTPSLRASCGSHGSNIKMAASSLSMRAFSQIFPSSVLVTSKALRTPSPEAFDFGDFNKKCLKTTITIKVSRLALDRCSVLSIESLLC